MIEAPLAAIAKSEALTMPTPRPAAFPCTRVTTNFGARIIARITLENPLKNSRPSSGVATRVSSSKEAPAQNGPGPPLRSTITRAESSFAKVVISAASRRSRVPGIEFPFG